METNTDYITIFNNGVLNIFCRKGTINDSKSIHVRVNCTNSVDGQIYDKFAGWLSRTMALHGGVNTLEYAYELGLKLIAENKQEIKESLVRLGRYMENIDKSGTGVTENVAHPQTEHQRNAIRKEMQKNAPEGTNHM